LMNRRASNFPMKPTPASAWIYPNCHSGAAYR
jgi:hypothetical protein